MVSKSYNQAFGFHYRWCPACSGPLCIVCTCIMYRSLIPVWSLWVNEVHSLSLLFGFLLLQVALQQLLDWASWWSFECYHPTCKPVSVHISLQRLCMILSLYSSCHDLAAMAVQLLYNAPQQESQLPGFSCFLLYSRKDTKRAYFGFMGVDLIYLYSRCVTMASLNKLIWRTLFVWHF